MATTRKSRIDYRETLRSLAQEYFNTIIPRIRPIFPRVLVYQLPKEQQTKSGLWLPDRSGTAKQMKPVTEGIVLRLWGTCHEKCIRENGEDVVYKIYPSVAVGDHVIFPHYAGYPPDPNYDQEFQLVPEPDIMGIYPDGEKESSYKEIIAAVSPILRKWQRLEYR